MPTPTRDVKPLTKPMIWSWISDSSGDTTTVTPGRRMAGKA
jgi:hypothetical protein